MPSSFSSESLSLGTYWITLTNGTTTGATSSAGLTLWWDESEGPSVAYNSTVSSGTVIVPSQSFEIIGASAVPEPTTMLLFGSGLIGLAELWRRFKN